MTPDSEDPRLAATILAIDYGSRRIGLAIKPAGQSLVLPIGIIDAAQPGRSPEPILDQLRRTIAERAVDIVVIGLPVHEDDRQAAEVRRFARKLREGITGVRWRFIDESLTTAAADDRLREAGFKPGRRANDAQAAAIILETWLSRPDDAR